MSEVLQYVISDEIDASTQLVPYAKAIRNNIFLNTNKNKNAVELTGHINRCLNSSKNRVDGLLLLHELLVQCTSELFSQQALTWCRLLHDILQSHSSETVKGLTCAVLTCLLKHAASFPEIARDVAASVLSPLVSSLISLSGKAMIGGFSCLCCCMTFFSGACGPFKAKIEKYVISILEESNDENIQELAARAFAMTARCGGGGNLGVKHTEAWSLQLDKVMGSMHVILDHMYQDCESENTINPSKLTIPLTPAADTEPARTLSLMSQFNILTKCFKALLSEEFPATVKVPLDDIIVLICRVLAVTPKSLGTSPNPEKKYLIEMLPEIHLHILLVLDTLIASCGGHMIPYSHVINQLFTQTLKWTNANPPVYGTLRPYSALRQQVYSCLCCWLHTVGAASNVEAVTNVLLHDVMSDIKAVEDTVKLDNKKSKKSVDVQQPPRKKRKGHLFAEAGQLTGQRKVDVHANRALCRDALVVLQLILKKAGCFVKPSVHKDLHEFLIPILLRIQQDPSNIPIPYGAALSRQELYNLLLVSVLSPHPNWLPPLSCVMLIMTKGQQDHEPQVSNFCSGAAINLENIVHPRVPCLMSALTKAKPESDSTPMASSDQLEMYASTSVGNESTAIPNFGNLGPDIVSSASSDDYVLIKPSTSKEQFMKPLLETGPPTNMWSNIDGNTAKNINSTQNNVVASADVEKMNVDEYEENENINSEVNEERKSTTVNNAGNETVIDIELAKDNEENGSNLETAIMAIEISDSSADSESVANEKNVTDDGVNTEITIVEKDVKQQNEDQGKVEHIEKMLEAFVDAGPDSDEDH